MLPVMPHKMSVQAPEGQGKGHQEAQGAVAYHQGPFSRVGRRSLGNRQRGGQRLGKDRGVVRHARGHDMEVFCRQGEVLGKSAVFAPQTQNPALLAVLGQALATPATDPAGNIDLPHHPLP